MAKPNEPTSGSPAAQGEPIVLTRKQTTQESDDESAGRRMDPELLVMGRIVRLLDELDEDAKRRVVCWMGDRWRQQVGEQFDRANRRQIAAG